VAAIFRICVTIVILASAAVVSADPVGYSSRWLSNFCRFDLATGTIEYVGTIEPDVVVVGLAFTPDGSLYGIDPGNDRLMVIDLTTGAGTAVGNLGVDVGEFVDLGVQRNGNLWLFDSQSAGLYRIDRGTGALTLMCQADPAAEAKGLVIRNDQFYVLAPDSDPAPGCNLTPFLGFGPNSAYTPLYPEMGPGGMAYVWADNFWGGGLLLKLDLDTGEFTTTGVGGWGPEYGGFLGSAFPPSALQTPSVPTLGVPAIVVMGVLVCLFGVFILRRRSL
jgi:hypothetical protein